MYFYYLFFEKNIYELEKKYYFADGEINEAKKD
jgi:hypothetical protein